MWQSILVMYGVSNGEIDSKGVQEKFLGDENVLYLDCDADYTGGAVKAYQTK